MTKHLKITLLVGTCRLVEQNIGVFKSTTYLGNIYCSTNTRATRIRTYWIHFLVLDSTCFKKHTRSSSISPLYFLLKWLPDFIWAPKTAIHFAEPCLSLQIMFHPVPDFQYAPVCPPPFHVTLHPQGSSNRMSPYHPESCQTF